MTDVFLHLFNTGISAGWLILAVIAVRFALRKGPRWLVCGLWVIVAARLLCPVSIEMPFSLIPSREVISPESMYDTAPIIDSGVEIIDNVINPIYTESLRTEGLASANPLQIWMAIWANIWLLGMVGMWIWAGVSWLRVKRQVSDAVSQGDQIWVSNRLDTPFILGVFRPRIYLPAGLAEPERGHVIAHERAHLARRDHWWKPFGYLLLSVFWFQPLMWAAYILLCRDIELACDEKVIAAMSLPEKKAYSTALLECSIRRREVSACPLAFGEVGVKARVQSVLHYKKPAFWVVIIGLVVCALLALGFLTDPVTRTAEIRYNGALYIQEGARQDFIPPEAVPVGELQTGIVDTPDHPTEDFQAVNLEDEYAGRDLYWYETEIDLELVRILYVECPRGGYLPFRLRTPNDLIASLIDEPLDIWVSVNENAEKLTGDRLIAMEVALESLRYADFHPGHVAEDIAAPVAIQFDRRGESANGIELTKYENGQWMLTVHDSDYGPGTWLFWEDGLTIDLEKQISRYGSQLGITLSVEDVTPTGLTLVCHQDGTPCEELHTGSPFFISRLEGDVWVSLNLSEETVWTMAAYAVPTGMESRWACDWSYIYGELPSGHYRISKTFTGKIPESGTVTALLDWTNETLYADFVIE